MRVALQSNLLANRWTCWSTAIHARPRTCGAVLASRLSVHDGMRVVLGHTTRSSGLSMASGMEHVIERARAPSTLTQSEPDLGRVTLSAELEPGRPLRLVKLLAYHWSSQESIDWLRDQVDASLEARSPRASTGSRRPSGEYLDDYWAVADVEVEGDAELQQALRFALFHIFQAGARAEGRAIPAKGLTGSGYDGHAFWDTESFVLPVLTYTAARAGRDALRVAPLHARPGARARPRAGAARGGLAVAHDPRRGVLGLLAGRHGRLPRERRRGGRRAPLRARDRRRGVRARHGLELLVETARLWASLGYHDARRPLPDRRRDRARRVLGAGGQQRLHEPDGAAEPALGRGRRRAPPGVRAPARRWTTSEIAAWRARRSAMYVPYDERLGVHPQDQDFTAPRALGLRGTPADEYPLLLNYPYFELYRRQVVKQADLVLAMLLARRRLHRRSRSGATSTTTRR